MLTTAMTSTMTSTMTPCKDSYIIDEYKTRIPNEVVYSIIDYVDYVKYGKIAHRRIMKEIVHDLNTASRIIDCSNANLPAHIIKLCWGNGLLLDYNRDDDYWQE